VHASCPPPQICSNLTILLPPNPTSPQIISLALQTIKSSIVDAPGQSKPERQQFLASVPALVNNLYKVRLDEERSDSSISPTTKTNKIPLVASLLAPLFASLIAAGHLHTTQVALLLRPHSSHRDPEPRAGRTFLHLRRRP